MTADCAEKAAAELRENRRHQQHPGNTVQQEIGNRCTRERRVAERGEVDEGTGAKEV